MCMGMWSGTFWRELIFPGTFVENFVENFVEFPIKGFDKGPKSSGIQNTRRARMRNICFWRSSVLRKRLYS